MFLSMGIYESFFYAFWIIAGLKFLFWLGHKLVEQYPIFLQEYEEELKQKELQKLEKKNKKKGIKIDE